ncbi:hypothetical protein ABZ840_26515 [Streptomyces sp. NPDC047117]
MEQNDGVGLLDREHTVHHIDGLRARDHAGNLVTQDTPGDQSRVVAA